MNSHLSNEAYGPVRNQYKSMEAFARRWTPQGTWVWLTMVAGLLTLITAVLA